MLVEVDVAMVLLLLLGWLTLHEPGRLVVLVFFVALDFAVVLDFAEV